ncbi:aldo/keto reductase [Halorhabdus sp. CUG00001]|uniref:aldo/keto reductase n=1 Tax=Halorhabdus sp. CUG00001 TaxID=2600297 RepID=UPI00131E58AA|nr:aldo/keto reductase [Halorhabdus sp. CUG00001]
MMQLPFGFGTAHFQSRAVAVESVKRALGVGYRHLDTADHYQYTDAVGAAIAEQSVPRENLFVATKLHSADLDPDSIVDRVDALSQALNVEVIDLVSVHWPTDAYDPERTFETLGRLQEAGDIRHVGVCNFTPNLLREAVDCSPVPIVAHQFEIHPFLPQNELIEASREVGSHVVAHSPLAGGRVFESETLQALADDQGVSVAQVVLAWLLDRKKVCPIPKATGEHIEENFAATALSIDAKAFDRIDNINTRYRIVDYEFAPWDE